jgi:hypothetical protein
VNWQTRKINESTGGNLQYLWAKIVSVNLSVAVRQHCVALLLGLSLVFYHLPSLTTGKVWNSTRISVCPDPSDLWSENICLCRSWFNELINLMDGLIYRGATNWLKSSDSYIQYIVSDDQQCQIVLFGNVNLFIALELCVTMHLHNIGLIIFLGFLLYYCFIFLMLWLVFNTK